MSIPIALILLLGSGPVALPVVVLGLLSPVVSSLLWLALLIGA